MTLAADDIALWRGWVGREERRTEVIEAESLRRYAAALREPLEVEARLPSLAHWACFLPVAAPDGLGVDGHPRRGGFLPPISLPRRMFAAGDIALHAPLAVGAEATRTSRILSIEHKAGRSGELVLVVVEHSIEQAGRTCIEERQTLVYRDAGAPTPAVVAAEGFEGGWQPGPVDLFRFSAVTFNSHRIHYDLPYATAEEGYPGLVVHGPFTAARLFGLAREGGEPRRFAFRAQAPLFAGQPIRLEAEAGTVRAIRCDGVVAMDASVNHQEVPRGS